MTVYRTFRIIDPDSGEVVEEFDDRDQCRPPMGDPPCGGCGHCLMRQAAHAGFTIEYGSEPLPPPPPPPPRSRTIYNFPPLWD